MTNEVKSPTLQFTDRSNQTSTGFVRWAEYSTTGSVLIGCHPVKDDEMGPWTLDGNNRELVREVGRYLGTSSVLQQSVSNAIGRLNKRERARLSRDDRRLFKVSLQAICCILAETALEAAYPQCNNAYVSRMGKKFVVSQVDEESRVVLLKISRGGDTPTHFASEHLENVLLNPPEILQASSQRQHLEKGQKPKVIYQIKGRTDLTGKILMIFEQAHASAETVVNVIPAALQQCKSKPERIIICCINSCEYAVKKTLETISDAIIINACLHNALTDQWYLDDIGCGDCGAEEHRVVD